ncbi:CCAAT/enhancer-binding protein zeta [Selaginella moellendorffii]|uniref:CCAAT/enhancer-binding protein zeta n=1 Tax=Selaginella moellendorffii TaxID=88036 RepID=UPI000D1C9C8D|nr:CCAAT/enhancer-binding protein zeta [Selaginella moellendorffii]|eukprot:XP_024524800.1 CCAAT/enhancer-binding protein zeta [Selaginella moellendorffii]
MSDEALKADVASFAANLGLASSQVGFNDADFRKKGPLKRGTARNPDKAEKSQRIPRKKKETGGNSRRDGRNAGSQARKWPPPKPRAEDWKNEAKKVNVSVAKVRFGKDVVHSLSRWAGSGEKWYETAAGISSAIQFVEPEKEVADGFVQLKRKEAEALLQLVAVEFERSRRNSSDMRMIQSARRSGTSGDKVAAMTILIQENPVANLQTLDSLLAMVTSKGGKRHALSGLDVLKELFIMSLLPDRKLTYFARQPLATLPETKEGAILLLWWFWEDCIKERYEKFVNAVIEGTKDALVYLKLKTVKTLYELLKAKPEQEKKLLSAVVNKLGDPERKAASNAGYFLSCLLKEHPNMTKVVLNEVEAFMFRPNLGMRAIYYASVFMNQLRLSYKGEGPNLAKQLIDIYFVMFKTITSRGMKKDTNPQKKPRKQSEGATNEDNSNSEASALDSRLISSLLTGVNKAFRFVTEDSAENIIEEHTPSLFLLAHSTNFNVAVQALLLLHQILAKHQTVSERFYRALYSVMLSPALLKSSKIEMYLALVFKVLRSDVSTSRTCGFIKRLMQVAVHQSPELGCAFLVLLSEVLKAKHILWNFILEPASQGDDVEHFKDVELPENQDVSALLPDAASKEPLRDDSDSEIDVDVEMAAALGEDGDSETEFNRKETGKKMQAMPTAKASPLLAEAAKNTRNSKGYDPRHRDPLHCKADQTCWWELAILASHIHPSVSTMAKTILSNAAVVYSGDPIQDLAFTAFLDRFAERKPKARKIGIDSTKKEAVSNAPMGMKLASLAEDDVAPSDLIFHRFYRAKAEAMGKRVKKKKKALEDFDDDMVGSDEELSSDDEEGGDEDEEGGDAGLVDDEGDSEEEEIDRLLDENDSEGAEFDLQDDDDDSSDDDEKLPEVLVVDKKNSKKKKKKKSAKNVPDDEDESSDDDEFDEIFLEDTKDKTKNKNRRGAKNRTQDGSTGSKRKSLYASAEDYTHILEGEGSMNKKKSKH